ncbi:MAG: hypothetical protein ACFCD0_19310 [Gemmataceae bacterium]
MRSPRVAMSTGVEMQSLESIHCNLHISRRNNNGRVELRKYDPGGKASPAKPASRLGRRGPITLPEFKRTPNRSCCK